MKKLIAIIIVLILFLFGAIFYTAFTPKGSNAVLKPIVNKKLKKSINGVDVEIKKLDSRYKYIDIDAIVENSIDINAKGEVDYFKKAFNLKYKAVANKVVVDNRAYPLNLNISGKAVGNVKDFLVDGYGKGFDSNIGYRVAIKNSKAESIKVNVNNAELSQLFLITRVEPLIDGLAFVNIKMPSLNIKNPSGDARVEIKHGRFNNRLIAKKYKIKLPKNEKFNLKLNAKVANKKVVGKGVVSATSLNIDIKKLISTLDFKITKAYIDANIDDLSRLKGVIGTKLQGSLALTGVVYSNLHKHLLQASLKSKSFGGLAKVFYSNNSLKANLKDVSIVKIEKMLAQPRYITKGKVDGVVKIPNLKKLNGSFNLKSSGVVNKRVLAIKLPSYKYSISGLGKLKSGALNIKKGSLDISDIKLSVSSAKYNFLTTALTTNFKLKVDNLADVKDIIKKRLRGPIALSGKLAKLGDNIDLQANTKSLGGVVNLIYNGKELKANFKNVSAHKLLYMLNQPSLLERGFMNAKVKLNTTKKITGSAKVTTNGLVNTKLVKKLYKINLGKSFKYQLKSDKIELIKNAIKSERVKISSNIFYLELLNLLYKTSSGNFKSKYSLKVDNLLDLKPIIKQKLVGDLKLNGVVEKDGSNILVSGVSSKFGGNVNFRLRNSKLTVSGAGVNIVEVLDMLNKPRVLDGVSTFRLNYNIKSKKGEFDTTISQAKFLKSSLVNNLKKYANFDLSQEVFKEAKIDGKIDDNILTFNLNAKGNSVKIVIKRGRIDTKKQTINAKVTIKHNGKDYNFKVKGPLDDPNIKLIFSGAVKEKVLEKVKDKLKESGLADEIDKLIPKELKGKNLEKEIPLDKDLEKKVKKKAKELFKNLF